MIYTDIHKKLTPPDELDKLKTRIPLGVLGEAEDIVGTVLFLASSGSAYITGEIVEVNGGMLMN